MTTRLPQILRVANFLLVAGIVAILAGIAYQVLSADPTTPRTELERALFTAEEAVKANPKDPASRIKLSAAYLERDNPTAALEQAEIGVRLDPKDPTGYYMKGLALRDLKRTDEAITTLEKAVGTEGQLAQFYQDAWLALSRAYEQKGDQEQALTAMTRALNNGPENVVILVARAQLYERAEDWTGALDDYAAALEYVPDYEVAREAFDRLKEEHPAEFLELQKQYGLDETTTPAPGNE